MMNTLFYISIFYYYYSLYSIDNFNPVGNEFVALVVLGFLSSKNRKQPI